MSIYRPSEEFVKQANISSENIRKEFDEGYPECFREYGELLDWDEKWDKVADLSTPPFYKWFVGGELNACYNCVDRHLEDRKNQAAIIWEGEPTDESETLTYRDLYIYTNAFSSLLKKKGVEEGDIVTLHLPMVPAFPISMLGCARIGALHSAVFAGFSANALAERIDDTESDIVVAIDGYYRRGDFLKHIEKAKEALEISDHDVKEVLVWTRKDSLHKDVELGDKFTVVDLDKRDRVEPVSRDSEDPLFLMYTSGTTGKPKGCQHRTGGYLAYASGTSKYVHDIKPEDTYWTAADIGWITGHTYIVYGPLSLGTTTVMKEGAPDHPDKGILWEIAERHDIDLFNTSPTMIRLLWRWGKEIPEKYDFDFRWIGTVGEPIEEKAWEWYYKHIGKENAVVVDKWWQTETGGNIVATLPGVDEMRPSFAGPPLPGHKISILDPETGDRLNEGEHGTIVLERPWPGMLQTIYGDDERFIEEYWREVSDTESTDWRDWRYQPEDEAYIEDEYVRFLGRLDEVMNVAGHRIGTKEIEDAVTNIDEVAEVAAVGKKHSEKGEIPDVYAVIEDEKEIKKEDLEQKAIESIEEDIGPIARPENIYLVENLPTTRSGKIMRRLLENISNNEPLGNTTTLKDPKVPENIREKIQTQN